MAEANPNVMQMIEAELGKDPDISNADLFEKAKAIDPEVAELSPRQFNATYPLQVKRAMKPQKKTRRRPRSSGATRRRSAGSADGRDRVRSVLLELAKDVADAQGKGDVVDVIAGIDRYVDRVLKATK